jgi:Zn-dependent metalloprotease
VTRLPVLNPVVPFVLLLVYQLSINGQDKNSAAFHDPQGKVVVPVVDPKSGGVKIIVNFSDHINNYGLTKNNITKQQLRDFGKRFVDRYSPLLNVTSKDFKETTIDTTGVTQVVSFNQMYHGILIVRSFIHITIGIHGEISDLEMKLHPHIRLSTEPSITSDQAGIIAQNDSGGHVTGKPELVILPQERETTYVYHLAWMVHVGISGASIFRYYISADNGSIIEKYNTTLNSKPHKSV